MQAGRSRAARQSAIHLRERLVHPVLLPSNELDQVLPNQGIECLDGRLDVRKGRSIRQCQCGSERESSVLVCHQHLAVLELVDLPQEVAH